MFLDEEFDKLLRGWVGRKKVAAIGEVAYKRLLEDNWERILKKRFDGSDRDWSFPTPREWEERKKGFRAKIGIGRKSNQSDISHSELQLTQ